MTNLSRVALIRTPSPALADGIVTHIDRQPVNLDLARQQHATYARTLRENGWQPEEVEPADDCPDSVFVEDTVIVFGGLAVITRPGVDSRLAETAGTEAAVRKLGLEVATITAPGTIDGGDVLQAGETVFVGRSGRTNAEGIRQLRRILSGRGRAVVAVPLANILHLKSAVTPLPDGTFLMWPGFVDPALFGPVRMVSEEQGAHVVPLDAERVLLSAAAPKTAELLDDLGFTPIVVDVSEYEKLEGGVTCLSVLIR